MNSNLRQWWVGLALVLLVMAPSVLSAQQSSGDDLYEDLYDEEDVEYEGDNMAFGFGAGIVLPEDRSGGEDGEIYYSANFRWRLQGPDSNDRRRRSNDGDYNARHNERHDRGRYPGGASSGGIRGYLEPEIGYWSRSETDLDIDDTYLGLNIVGVVPTRYADFFLGVGFGFHSIDGKITNRDNVGNVIDEVSLDDTLGGNFHVGVELYITDSLGVFGTGRLDILEDRPFDRQTKVWGGLRFHF